MNDLILTSLTQHCFHTPDLSRVCSFTVGLVPLFLRHFLTVVYKEALNAATNEVKKSKRNFELK